MSGIQVDDLQQRAGGERAELSARVEGLPPGLGEQRLWFRFPPEFESWLSRGAEPMVAALLPVAMLLHRGLRVQGQVSPLFLSGCRQIMRLYSQWDARLRPIEVNGADPRAESSAAEANAAFFTGGVDSQYTLLKNLERERGDCRISHLVFVQGYADCPLDQPRLCENLAAQLRKAAAAFNLTLVLAETNLKAFTPPPGTAWDWYAGSQLAAVGLCLERGVRRLYVPAGDTYSTLSPWGSHPLVDPLWSTEGLEFRHDGCEAFRSQKLDWFVARSPVALRHLRVCGYDSTGLRNCGRCEKCLRTMIGLAALGVEPPAGLFARQLDLGLVRQLDGGNRVIGYYLRDNLRLLEATGKAPELEQAVRHALRASGRRWLLRRLRNAVREIDRRYLGSRARAWALQRAGADVVSQSELRMAPARWVFEQVWRRGTARGRGKDPNPSEPAQRRLP